MASNRGILVLMLAVLLAPFGSRAESILADAGRIALPGVKGRIDHMAIDIPGGRIFIAALGNQTLEVADLRDLRAVNSLARFREPQGILALPGHGRIYVTDGKASHSAVLDIRTLENLSDVTLADDGDNIRYEEEGDRVWIGAGAERDSVLISLDAATGSVMQRIPLAGHPESFQLERQGRRIFVNVPTARVVQVVDRDAGKVVAVWNVPARANYPMALDEQHRRLFVVSRLPAKLLVYDTGNGEVVASMETVGDADDVFYDTRTRRLYISGGEGFVYVYRQDDADHYVLLEKVATRQGARTSLLVPELDLLFVAAPRRGEAEAEIRLFRVHAP
jgi:hypothetical protein